MCNSKTRAASRNAAMPASAGAHPPDLPPPWQRLLAADPATHDVHDTAPGAARPHGQLGLLLDVRANDSVLAELEVAPVLLAYTPQSKVAQSRAVALDEPPPAGLTSRERQLVAQLAALPQRHRKGRTYVPIAGPAGDQLVADMLALARCFLGGLAGFELRRGAQQAVRWRWDVAVDGVQRLVPQLPQGQQIVRAGGAWYLDPEQAVLGPLRGPLLAAGALDLPALQPTQACAVADAMRHSALAGLLPEPARFEPASSVDRVPTAQLTLEALQRATQDPASTQLVYARLAFDYAGVALSGREPETALRRVRGKHLMTVKRHRADELAALDRLEGQGLVLVVDCEGLPWQLTRVLPEHAWLFPGTGYRGALEVNTPTRWLAMRRRLQEEGFEVGFGPQFPYQVPDEPPRWYVHARPDGEQQSYRLEIGVCVDDERFDLLPAASTALADGQLTLAGAPEDGAEELWFAPLDEHRRVPVSRAALRALLQPVADWLGQAGQPLRLPWGQAGRLEELAKALPPDGVMDAPPRLADMAARLRRAASRPARRVPVEFTGTLRGYQREGLRWLEALAEAGLGGVLADDMGLGKTVQLLVHVLARKAAGALHGPVLVVAPTSLLPSWAAELRAHAPGLRHVTVHGTQRAALLQQVGQQDVVLTSYALLPRDIKAWRRHRYPLLVLDEAQQVKNPRTRARRAAFALRAERRLCLTGTPLENHLGELWSQLDLAVPGLLGSQREFQTRYRVPIEKHADEACRERLNRRIAPFILRRTKAQVVRELPSKTELARQVELGPAQRRLYESLNAQLYEQLRQTIADEGIERSGIVVLDALLKLRQVCCDPRLLKGEHAAPGVGSAKFDMLMDMLTALLAEDRRILLFSQFTEMLDLVADALRQRGIGYLRLTGQTRDRAEPVARFQNGDVPLFLLSLKAGGVGLNLTAADTVIHYDPWWNPAAETQASDRAHRIGQDKPVFVYRLICANTVEQRIEALKARKAALADAVLADGGSRDQVRFTEQDLDTLFGVESTAYR